MTPRRADFAADLLSWYDRHHRALPWRTPPHEIARGVRPDPYHVWLSEIMLQQTTVAAVRPYFEKFTRIWPSVTALAAADADDVMKAWAGLGYYSRARNLKKCADIVAGRQDGAFPANEKELRALPGVGAYTAAAIAAIAFDLPSAVIDGNVERVAARLFAISTPLPEAKKEIRAAVDAMTPDTRPGDFAQAMMDLGATVCTPRAPACVVCPLAQGCAGLRTGEPARLPVKSAPRKRPRRRGAAYVAMRADGAILLRKRPERGLLGGMSEVPTTHWTSRMDGEGGTAAAPFAANWREAGTVEHVFTHFELRLDVYLAEVADTAVPAGHWWSKPGDVAGEALPSVMKKVVAAAFPDWDKPARAIVETGKS